MQKILLLLQAYLVVIASLFACQNNNEDVTAAPDAAASAPSGTLKLQDFAMNEQGALALRREFQGLTFEVGKPHTVTYQPDDQAIAEAKQRSIAVAAISKSGQLVHFTTQEPVKHGCYFYLLEGRSELFYITQKPQAIDDFFDNAAARLVAISAGELCLNEGGRLSGLSTYSRLNMAGESFANLVSHLEDSGIIIDFNSEKPSAKLVGTSSWFSSRVEVPRSDVDVRFDTPSPGTKTLGETFSRVDARLAPSRVDPPAPNTVQWDARMGMYWMPAVGKFWDANLKMYYDGKIGVHWDPVLKMHYDSRRGMHYDASVSMHYDASARMHWDAIQRMHYDVRTKTYFDKRINMVWDPVQKMHWDPGRLMHWDATAGKHFDTRVVSPVTGVRGMYWDEAARMHVDSSLGMHYDASVNLYWDPGRKMHWSSLSGMHWERSRGLWFDSGRNQYYLPEMRAFAAIPTVVGRAGNVFVLPGTDAPLPRVQNALIKNVTMQPAVPPKPPRASYLAHLGPGRTARYGVSNKSDLLVLSQGPTGTCLPTSAAMVLDTFGVKFSPDTFKDLISSNGGSFTNIVAMTERLNGVGGKKLLPDNYEARFQPSTGIPDPRLHAAKMSGFLKDGPILAGINLKFADGTSGGHAIVVDRVTKIGDSYVVSGRNPWGEQFSAFSHDLTPAFKHGGAEFGDKQIIGVEFFSEMTTFTKLF